MKDGLQEGVPETRLHKVVGSNGVKIGQQKDLHETIVHEVIGSALTYDETTS